MPWPSADFSLAFEALTLSPQEVRPEPNLPEERGWWGSRGPRWGPDTVLDGVDDEHQGGRNRCSTREEVQRRERSTPDHISTFYVPKKSQVSQKRKDFTTKCIKQKLVHCCDVGPNLVVEIENFNFCLFVCLLVCLYLTFCPFRNRKMIQSGFQKLF